MSGFPPDADVWVLGGQSNMAGWGCGEAYETPSDKVWLFNVREEWKIAEEPFIVDRYESVEDAFAIMRGESQRNAITPEYRRRRSAEFPGELQRGKCAGGLGLTFGKAISEFTRRPVGLVFCAKGDSRMEEWDPDYKGNPYMELYGATLRRIRKANRPIAGILWYQGESDTSVDRGNAYGARMRKFVAALRRDVGRPDLPFVYVQIATCVQQTEAEMPDWNLVQETQRRLEPDLAPGCMCVSVDLPLFDGVHVATAGLQRLGKRLANAVRRMLYKDTGIEIGPRPVAVKRDPHVSSLAHVHFASVNGRLLPEQRVSGFSIYAPGENRDLVSSSRVSDDSTSTVLVRTWRTIPPGSVMWYGKGLAPFCNLVDAADMAAPVFGPWTIAG